MIVLLFLVDSEEDGVSKSLAPQACFHIRGGRKWTSLNNRRWLSLYLVSGNVMKPWPPKCLRRRALHLWERLSCPTISHSLHRYVFSGAHCRQRPKLLRNLSQMPPPPQPPNPIHIIFQSSSSCSRGLSIFYFPFSPPPLPCPPALSIFSNTLPTVQPVSLRFFFYSAFSLVALFHSLVRVSPLWQGRSPSRARSCLRFVNGDVM